MVENIQNKVRNKLGTIQTLNDICKILVSNDADSEKSVKTFDYLVKSELINVVQQSIEDLIDIAKECDKKINDENFDVWDEVLKNRK